MLSCITLHHRSTKKACKSLNIETISLNVIIILSSLAEFCIPPPTHRAVPPYPGDAKLSASGELLQSITSLHHSFLSFTTLHPFILKRSASPSIIFYHPSPFISILHYPLPYFPCRVLHHPLSSFTIIYHSFLSFPTLYLLFSAEVYITLYHLLSSKCKSYRANDSYLSSENQRMKDACKTCKKCKKNPEPPFPPQRSASPPP